MAPNDLVPNSKRMYSLVTPVYLIIIPILLFSLLAESFDINWYLLKYTTDPLFVFQDEAVEILRNYSQKTNFGWLAWELGILTLHNLWKTEKLTAQFFLSGWIPKFCFLRKLLSETFAILQPLADIRRQEDEVWTLVTDSLTGNFL